MLTETIIRKLPVPTTPRLIGDGNNLYLRLAPTGGKTWKYRTRQGGHWRVVGLGTYPSVSLAAARHKAASLSVKADIPESMTFGALLDKWYASVEPRYALSSAKIAQLYVAHGKRTLGSLQLGSLSTARLVAVLDEYAKSSPASANRCLSVWKLSYDFAISKGLLEHNPLARITTKSVGGSEKSRERVLTDAEIVALWHSGPSFFRFLLLTGLRISEALQGHLEGDKWIVPAAYSKNRKPHWCHLPPLALAQVGDWPWRTMTPYQEWLRDYCAANVKGMSFTPHDLRRTFRTRLGSLGVLPHVAEKMINHSLQGVLAVYDRHDYADERIAASAALAGEIARIVECATP